MKYTYININNIYPFLSHSLHVSISLSPTHHTLLPTCSMADPLVNRGRESAAQAVFAALALHQVSGDSYRRRGQRQAASCPGSLCISFLPLASSFSLSLSECLFVCLPRNIFIYDVTYAADF